MFYFIVKYNAFALLDTGSEVSLINWHFIQKYYIKCENLNEAVILSTAVGAMRVQLCCRMVIHLLGVTVSGIGLVVTGIPYDVILGGNILVGQPFLIDLRNFSLKRICLPSVDKFTVGALTLSNTAQDQGPASVLVGGSAHSEGFSVGAVDGSNGNRVIYPLLGEGAAEPDPGESSDQ